MISIEETANVYKILAQAATPVSEVLGKIGKEIERLFTPILLPEEPKKLRLPRKLKKLAKHGQPKKYRMSKETVSNIAFTMWGKPKQYRTTKYKNL